MSLVGWGGAGWGGVGWGKQSQLQVELYGKGVPHRMKSSGEATWKDTGSSSGEQVSDQGKLLERGMIFFLVCLYMCMHVYLITCICACVGHKSFSGIITLFCFEIGLLAVLNSSSRLG